MWNFGVSFSNVRPALNLYHFGVDGRLISRFRVPLEHPCSMHDFCLAPHHAVFHVGPYLLDMQPLLAGGTLMESLRWEPWRGTKLLCVDRATGEVAAAVPVGDRYSLHTINGFERDGHLVVDVLELDRPVYDQYQEVPNLFTAVGEGGPVRFVIDVARGVVAERRELSYRLAPDFAVVDPRHVGRAGDDFWMLGISATGKPGRKFLDELVHLSWARPQEADLWRAPRGSYLGGEPVFVGKPGDEGAGVVICQLFDSNRDVGSFLVFDAFAVARGPLAVLELETPVHLGFHATFSPEESPRSMS
jgi:carotenoid cleavage dioxygenase-like enzyme